MVVTTTLEFRLDQRALAQDKQDNPSDAPLAALQETYLVMPTRLRVGGVDMFARRSIGRIFEASDRASTTVVREAHTEEPWLSLPLLHVASIGVAALNDAI